MNHELWQKIEAFNLDNPPSEYGFSTRLANENFWTIHFTEQAILEYKKFMYLAASSNFMVSPSEVVDIVWHQHLIFTQSYQEFCNLIGKQVQHIPSTHNKEDFQKFKLAKERTTKLYEDEFGKQPNHIWGFSSMYDSLNLAKAKFKLRTFIIIGILAFVAITTPAYWLLKPIYVSINNPDFVLGIIGISIFTFIGLEIFNNNQLKKITRLFDSQSFIFHLHPYELAYLKSQNLASVANGTINELLMEDVITLQSNYSIELFKQNSTVNHQQLQVTSVLSEMGLTSYARLLKILLTKPIFTNTSNCMDAFKKYFNKSQKFGTLFYLNFVILATLVLLSFTRIVTGVLREKPVIQIVFITIVLIVSTILFLTRLTKKISTNTIPNLYQDEILPQEQSNNNWQWRYALVGNIILNTNFRMLINYTNRATNDSTDGGSSTSSCGSSCGSSCSSCGGCGGD